MHSPSTHSGADHSRLPGNQLFPLVDRRCVWYEYDIRAAWNCFGKKYNSVTIYPQVECIAAVFDCNSGRSFRWHCLDNKSIHQDSWHCAINFPFTLGRFATSGLPNVISAIDCTHISVRAPSENEFGYVNRKHVNSINVQVVCDSNMVLTNVQAQWPGSAQAVEGKEYKQALWAMAGVLVSF